MDIESRYRIYLGIVVALLTMLLVGFTAFQLRLVKMHGGMIGQGMSASLTNAGANACRKTLMDLRVCLFDEAQANDRCFPPEADFWAMASKSKQWGTEGPQCMLGRADHTDYSYNINIERVELGTVADAERTIVLYETRKGKPDFRHMDKDNCKVMQVVFADGSIGTVRQADFDLTVLQHDPMLSPDDTTAFPAPLGSVEDTMQDATMHEHAAQHAQDQLEGGYSTSEGE